MPPTPRPSSHPQSPHRTQSYSPRNTPARPMPARRYTEYMQRPTSSPHRTHSGPSSSPRRRTSAPVSSPLRTSSSSPRYSSGPTSSRRRSSTSRGTQDVLIPVPIRALDSETPLYVRAPSGQSVDFVFSKPRKRGIFERLLDSIEWGHPDEKKKYLYRKPSKPKPFYKKLLS